MNNKILKSNNIGVKNDNKGKIVIESAEPIFVGLVGLTILVPYIFDETIWYQAYILKVQEYLLKNPQAIVKGGCIVLGATTIVILLDALRYIVKNK